MAYPYQFPLAVREVLEGLPSLAGVAAEGTRVATEAIRSQLSGHEPWRIDSAPIMFAPVTPDYFFILGLPLAAGRSFTSAEAAGEAQVAVLGCRALASWGPKGTPSGVPADFVVRPEDLELHRLLPGDTFKVRPSSGDPQELVFTVVGTLPETGDLRVDMYVFVPIGAEPWVETPLDGTLGFRFWCRPHAGELEKAMAEVHSALKEYDREDGLVKCTPIRISQVVFYTVSKTSAAGLLAISGLALLVLTGNLAALLMLYVATNSPGLGLRRSLGAPALTVFGEVVRAALRLVTVPSLVGLLAGTLLSPWTSRLLGESIRPGFLALTLSMGAILVVTLLAALYPAYLAVSLPPARVMRGAVPLSVRRPFCLDPRTFMVLTVVAVGVGAVVTATGIGRGVDARVEAYLAGVREGLVEVKTPETGMAMAPPASFGDGPGRVPIDQHLLARLAGLPDVEAGAFVRSMPAVVTARPGEDGPEATAWIAGINPEYGRVWDLRPADGRWLTDDDRGGPVAVVGHSLARRLEIEDGVPTELLIGGTIFTVVGRLEPRPSGVIDFAVDRENAVFILHHSLTLIEDARYQVATSAIFLRSAGRDGAGLAEEVTGFLEREYPGRILPEVRLPSGDLSAVREVQRHTYRIFTLLAGLVLVMALVGLGNLFFLRTVESRRQIGVRRALGATALRIALRSAGEAAMLGLVGASLGVAASWALLSATGQGSGQPVVLSARWIAGAAILALTSGLLGGLLPAFSISRQPPGGLLRGRAQV
jgi:putative ABC transport system permease protein